MTRAEHIEQYLRSHLVAAGHENIDLSLEVTDILDIADTRELMALRDFADLIGRNRNTILSWIERGKYGIPAPISKPSSGNIWDGEQLRAWACSHPECQGTQV